MNIKKRKDGVMGTINRHRSEKIHMHQFFFAFAVFFFYSWLIKWKNEVTSFVK